MSTVGRGTKIKISLEVNGLGEKTLKDNDVDFKITFYAKNRDSAVSGYYVVNKGDAGKAFASAEDENVYHIICDTTGLDLGTVGATLEVTYTDEDTNVELTEILQLTSDVKLIDVPQQQESNGGGGE